MVSRESQSLMQELTGLACWATNGENMATRFFIWNPNIKDGPYGLRDYQVACWLAQIAEMKRSREWNDAVDERAAGAWLRRGERN